MSEKPIGWRPLSDEYRETLVAAGLTPEQIAEQEAGNVYAPNPDVVQVVALTMAIMEAANKALGRSFVDDVKASIERRAERLATSDDGEDLVEAPMVKKLIEGFNWEGLIARSSAS